MDWTNRVAIITGASSGIGRAVARALVARGTRVALVARSADKLEALVSDRDRNHEGELSPRPEVEIGFLLRR